MNVLQKLSAFYRLLNLLSVDVAFGAVCSAVFFAQVLHASISYFDLLALFLSVWIIYTADHLLDARKTKASATTKRHRFHHQHFRFLFILLTVAIGVNAILLFCLQKPTLISGVVLISLVMVYLAIHHSLKFLKEVFVAMIYSVGTLLPALSAAQISLIEWPWVVIAQFFLLALLNLIIFSWFDFDNDVQDGRVSVVTVVGKKMSQVFIVFLFILSTTLLIINISVQPETGIFFWMNAVLFILFFFPSYFVQCDRYRLLGDAVFFFPLLSWFF